MPKFDHVDPSQGEYFAWCFSHGRLHRFGSDGAWCTASWVRLAGTSEVEALADKQEAWGEGQFDHNLHIDKQIQLYERVRERKGR